MASKLYCVKKPSGFWTRVAAAALVIVVEWEEGPRRDVSWSGSAISSAVLRVVL